ncbi:MAG: hypothetical protein ACI4MI_02560 [Christensenellales bacterium]
MLAQNDLTQSPTHQALALGIFLLVGIIVGILNVAIKIVKDKFARRLWSKYTIDFFRVVIDGLSFALSQYAYFDFDIQAFHVAAYVTAASVTYNLIYNKLIPEIKNYIFTKRLKQKS